MSVTAWGDSLWLLIVGVLVGLVTTQALRGKAYDSVAVALLGITGACAADWLVQTLNSSKEVAWGLRFLLAASGAAAVPAVVHSLTRRRQSRAQQTGDKRL
jgi:uncharacterized membrane protein YeaQ/YmgE (transglycosylase-associated protein family)